MDKFYEGQRVKVVFGVDKKGFSTPEFNSPQDRQLWVGGEVPVGSEGTVIKVPGSDMLAIDFDDIKPRRGYFFGINQETRGIEPLA